MAGKFIISKYERDDETIAPIRIQPETVTAFNAEPAGNRTGEFARARGSKRSYGTVARSVTLSRAVGDGTNYNGARVSIKIPILSKAAFAALTDGQVVSYADKTDWVVAGQSAESRK